MSPTPPTADPRERVQLLFIEHMDVVRGFVLGLMPDFARADDVVQETFLTALKKASDFQPDTNFIRWACAIARYKVMEARRAIRPSHCELSDEVLEALAMDEAAVFDDPRLDRLRTCLDKLAPAARRAVKLCYEGDHKPGEIARLLGCGPDSIYVTLSRSRSFLRDCISRRRLAESGPA